MPSSSDPNGVDSDAETLEEGGDPIPSSSGETREVATGAINPTWEGETLALDDQYAETQVVEDWVDTQVVPDYEEEEEEGEEGRSERTEVLSDGGGEDDEVASRVLEDRGGGGERDDGGSPECDSSAPVSGSGSARKSFSSVRTESLRASGRAAICKATTTCPLFEQSSVLLNSNLNQELKSDMGGKPRTEDEKLVSAVDIVSSNEVVVADKPSNHEIAELGNFKHCGREGPTQKNGNGVARCLFQEDIHAHLDEHQKKSGIKGDKDLSQLPDHPIAGLSYIGSQEPGEASQANAIEVVDRLLFLTDLGISEDASIEENIKVPSPASTGVKGVKCLAKVARNSPIGKKATFDWNDAFEDEGGGDFFVKRKSFFFDDDGASKKSQSLPPKSRNSSQRETGTSVKKKGASSPKSLSKLGRLGFSDSVPQRPISIGRGNGVTPKRLKEGRSKTTVKDNTKKVNMDFASNLEEDDFGTDMVSFHDVGPDTQMAAEAMEALVSAIPEDFNSVRFNQTSTPEHRMQSACPNKEHSEVETIKNKRPSFSFGSDVTLRRSKRLGASGAWLSSGTESTIGKDGEKLLKRNRSARNKYTKGKPVSEKKVLSKDPIDKRKCVDGDSLTTGRGKTKKGQNRELAKKKTKIDNFNKQNGIGPKADKSLSSTPISCRTRNSVAGKSRKLVDLSHIDVDTGSGKNAAVIAVTGGLNLKSSEAAPVLSRDGRCSETRKKDTSSNQTNNAKVPCQGTGGSMVEVVPFHPKRRRTCISRKVTSASDLSSLQNIQTTMEDNFVADKRENEESKRGQMDHLHSTCSSISMAFVSGVGKKPSSYSDCPNAIPQQSKPLQMYEDDSACDRSSVPSDRQGTLKYSNLSSCGTNTTANVVGIGSPASDMPQKRKKHPSDTVHISSPKRVVEGSPVCTANVPLKTVHKDACKTSIARELIRLVSSDTTQIPVLEYSRRMEMSSVCALFSRHLEEKVVKHLGKIAKRLGISIASSISDATHFIADKFVRTRNLLEAMAVGKPVVTPLWLKKCGELSSLVDEKSYLLRDFEKEKEIGFSMPVSLARSSQVPLLEGKRIFLTPNVKPDRKTVSSLIKAAGGQPLERIGRSTINDDKILDGLLIISCEEDYAACASLLEKGAEVFCSELLLNGIVIQRLEYDRHRLFLDHVKQTRTTLWLKNEGSNQFHPVARRK